MIAYVDSSVVLRLVLGQPGVLAEWSRVERAISSSMTRVECLRTLENFRRHVAMPDQDVAVLRSSTLRILESFELLDPDALVLDRASAPMPTALRTLDAIHLATALLWIGSKSEPLVLATHDRALGTAAHAFGLEVIGLA